MAALAPERLRPPTVIPIPDPALLVAKVAVAAPVFRDTTSPVTPPNRMAWEKSRLPTLVPS